MTQLFSISSTTIQGQTTQTVNASELYARLEVSRDFSTWITAQVRRAGLEEGLDFVKLSRKDGLSTTGQTSIDYHLTVDSAKHIAMMSSTPAGKVVRNYFIECEKMYLAHQERRRNDLVETRAQALLSFSPLEGILELAQKKIRKELVALARPKVKRIMVQRLGEVTSEWPPETTLEQMVADVMIFYTANIEKLMSAERNA